MWRHTHSITVSLSLTIFAIVSKSGPRIMIDVGVRSVGRCQVYQFVGTIA